MTLSKKMSGGSLTRVLPLCLRRELFRMKIALAYVSEKDPIRPGVFILSTPRTGSNLLMSYLHPERTFEYEILSKDSPHGLRIKWLSKRSVFRHIRHFLHYTGEPSCPIKILFHQIEAFGISPEEIYAEFPSTKWIILYRENILNQYLSQELAYQTGRWIQLRQSPEKPQKKRVHLHPEIALKYRDDVRQKYQKTQNILGLGDRSVWISYEALAAGPQKIFDETLFPFLEITPYPVSTKLIKQNTQTYAEIIANYDEVKDLISQTDFTQNYPPCGMSLASTNSRSLTGS